MIVYVTRGLRIATDGTAGFKIEIRRVTVEGKNPGAVRWEIVGYYPSFEMAAQAVLTRGLAVNEKVMTIEKLITGIAHARKAITEVCEGAITRAQMAAMDEAFNSETMLEDITGEA